MFAKFCRLDPILKTRIHTIPNGGSRHIVEAVNLKAEGILKGVPDYFLPLSRHGYHGLYIELKKTVGGSVSPEQQAFIDQANKDGYLAVVAFGWEKALLVTSQYTYANVLTFAYTDKMNHYV